LSAVNGYFWYSPAFRKINYCFCINMKEAFFLSVRLRAGRPHMVHKGNCPFLEGTNDSKFLGNFSSPGEAIREAGKFFHTPDRCGFCMKKEDHAESSMVPFQVSVTRKYLSSRQVESTWESPLIMSKS